MFPKLLAEIRAQSYRKYAWPRIRDASSAWLAVALVLIVVDSLAGGTRAHRGADFYGVIPHRAMVAIVRRRGGAFILAMHVMGLLRFWRDVRWLAGRRAPLLQAASRCAALKNLSTSRRGLHISERTALAGRRWFHHFTFYGFLLCFASTTRGRALPFCWAERAVSVLERAGDSGNARRHRSADRAGGTLCAQAPPRSGHRRSEQDRSDVSFLALLFLTSLTGLLLLLFAKLRRWACCCASIWASCWRCFSRCRTESSCTACTARPRWFASRAGDGARSA